MYLLILIFALPESLKKGILIISAVYTLSSFVIFLCSRILGASSLLLVFSYPLMKRFTFWVCAVFVHMEAYIEYYIIIDRVRACISFGALITASGLSWPDVQLGSFIRMGCY